MPQEFENSDLIARFLESMISVVGRRSSEGYAAVMVNNITKKLMERYNFLRYVEIKDTRYSESKDIVNVEPAINSLSSNEIRNAIQELLTKITAAIGNTAGYFFIKELKERIGPDCELALQDIGIDLDLMQFEHAVEKRQKIEMHSTKNVANVLEHVLQVLFDILEEEIGKDFAKSTISSKIQELTNEYDFLNYVTIHDIDEKHVAVYVAKDINKIASFLVSSSLEKLMIGINKSLEEKDICSLQYKLKRYLDEEYLLAITKMGVRLKLLQISNELVFRHVIMALVDVLSRVSTQSYAVFAVNTFLRKIDTRHDFLKYIKIDPAQYPDTLYETSIMTKLDEISETDARRAIQKLLEEAVNTLGKDVGDYFVDEFENSLEKSYLLRIEEMGVNLHLIGLRYNMVARR